MAHMYNGILLSHKKNWNYSVEYYSAIYTVICSEVDGPRVSHTEGSKSEREKQIPYANIYIYGS